MLSFRALVLTFPDTDCQLSRFTFSSTKRVERTINISTLTSEEARKLQSEEQKALGYRPPPGSLSAEAQSVVDKRDREPVTKGSSSDHNNHPPQKRRNRKKLNKNPHPRPPRDAAIL